MLIPGTGEKQVESCLQSKQKTQPITCDKSGNSFNLMSGAKIVTMEVPPGYQASPRPLLFLKRRDGQRKFIVLFEGVPKPQLVSEMANRNGNLDLISIQFRIHRFTHSWIETIGKFRETILQSPEAYKKLSSIEVQVGKNCSETTYFQDAVLENLKGLNVQLMESTSRKSGTTSGLKLKFFYSNGIGNALEYFTNNLGGIGEIEFCDLRTRTEKLMSSEGGCPLSPQELVTKILMWHPINDNWLQIVSSSLQTRLTPEERLNHFYSNLEIEPLSPAFIKMYEGGKISAALQVFFNKRTFNEAEKHLRDILRSLGEGIEKVLDSIKPIGCEEDYLFSTTGGEDIMDTTDYMPMMLDPDAFKFESLGPELSELIKSSLKHGGRSPEHSYNVACSSKKLKIESRQEYNLSSGVPAAIIIVQEKSVRMKRDANNLCEVLKNSGFRTRLLDDIPSKFESFADPGQTSILFVALFSPVFLDARQMKMPLLTSKYSGIPKVFLFNYYRAEPDQSFDTSKMDSKPPEIFEKCVKFWARGNFPYLRDCIVCLSHSNSDLEPQTFVETLVQGLKEANSQKRDFTSILFHVAGRSLGFFESQYFQFGLNRRLGFPVSSENLVFPRSRTFSETAVFESKHKEQKIDDNWVLGMMTGTVTKK